MTPGRMLPDLPPEIAARVKAVRAESANRLRDYGGPAKLDLDEVSPAEHRVLVHIGEGLSNEEIATLAFIGHETVKSHVRNMLHRCNCRNRAQLAYRWGRGEIAVAFVSGVTKVTLVEKTRSDL